MRHVANPSYQTSKSLRGVALLSALAVSVMMTGHAWAQDDAADQVTSNFIPFVDGFEMPEDEGATTASLPGPEDEVSLERFKEDYARLKETINQRLGELNVDQTFDRAGDFSGLSSVDTSQYQSDLDQYAAVQREIRLLQMRLEQATVAQELWSVLFGEEEKDKAEENQQALILQSIQQGMGGGQQGQAAPEVEEVVEEEEDDGPTLMMTTSDGWSLFQDRNQVYFARELEEGVPDLTTIQSVEDVMMQRVQDALHAERQREPTPGEATSASGPVAALPSVVAISGVGKNLRARVNDPNLGIVEVAPNQTLSYGVRVVDVTPHGVTFSSEDGSRRTLGVGVTGHLVK